MSDTPDTGDLMPDIALEAPDGAALRPSDFRGRALVMFFYPKDDTPGCTAVAKDFSAMLGEFEAAGAALLGVSKDPPAKHARFIQRHDLQVALASDTATDGLADALGIWIQKSMFGKKYMGMARTTYLVDAGGRIARVWHRVKVRGHAAEVLEAVRLPET